MYENGTTKQTIIMTKQQQEILREIAKDHGYLIGRGREADWGSIRQLVLAIADGELHLKKKHT